MHASLHRRFLLTEFVMPHAVFPVSLACYLAFCAFAQIQAPPIDHVGAWLWSALGVIAIVVLILNGVIAVQKVFGRTPPIAEVLAGLATLKHIDATNESIDDFKKEMHLRNRGMEEQISALRHEVKGEYHALKLAAEDRRESFDEHMGELRAEVSELRTEVAGMRERTGAQHASVERKVDTIESKLDRLIERLGGGPARRT